ncbi:hypothetical protein Naga_101800g1 [Nannochloropsis gaditana]|uniref:Uncharacterized protein n=1 Tax=Nannochloropsis gaditana TaxID=72520 RepID=W7T9Q5_9STRA|nr:hypothetical protein Naga_101800g1 [Nannochloropsis gaditana]
MCRDLCIGLTARGRRSWTVHTYIYLFGHLISIWLFSIYNDWQWDPFLTPHHPLSSRREVNDGSSIHGTDFLLHNPMIYPASRRALPSGWAHEGFVNINVGRHKFPKKSRAFALRSHVPCGG